MHGVRDGKYYCPKYEDIRLLPCPQPPKVSVLIALFRDALKNHKPKLKTIRTGFLQHATPNSAWLVACISTLNPACEIFGKNYRPPQNQKTRTVGSVLNKDGFYTGLPPSKSKKKRRSHAVMKIQKEAEPVFINLKTNI